MIEKEKKKMQNNQNINEEMALEYVNTIYDAMSSIYKSGDQDCCICLLRLNSSDFHSCQRCKKIVHSSCFKQSSIFSKRQKCPYCRFVSDAQEELDEEEEFQQQLEQDSSQIVESSNAINIFNLQEADFNLLQQNRNFIRTILNQQYDEENQHYYNLLEEFSLDGISEIQQKLQIMILLQLNFFQHSHFYQPNLIDIFSPVEIIIQQLHTIFQQQSLIQYNQ